MGATLKLSGPKPVSTHCGQFRQFFCGDHGSPGTVAMVVLVNGWKKSISELDEFVRAVARSWRRLSASARRYWCVLTHQRH